MGGGEGVRQLAVKVNDSCWRRRRLEGTEIGGPDCGVGFEREGS